jgi:hypothetical protein
VKSITSKYFLVQIHDDLTLFFGGENSPKGILTYNWTSTTYTSQTPQLTKTRIYSACAVFKGIRKKIFIIILLLYFFDKQMHTVDRGGGVNLKQL